MLYKFVCNIDKKTYDKFVDNYSMASFMQNYNWANVKDNWDSYRCGVYENNEIVSVFLILVKTVFKKLKIFYVPRGYLTNYKNKKLLSFITEEIKKLAIKDNAFLIKIDPNFCISDDLINDKFKISHNYSIDYKIKHNNLIDLGYIYRGIKKDMHSNFQPQYNMVVPLIDDKNNILSIDELKNRYNSKFKYYIDDYLDNRGVSIQITNDINMVNEFVKLLNCTENRNNIKLRDEGYFKRILTNFENNSYMFFGKVDLKKYLNYIKLNNINNSYTDEINTVKEILKNKNEIYVSCGLVILPSNKTGIRTSEYLYAGNNLVLKKLSVSQGLVFEILKFSINNNCHYCNLGGIDGNLNDNLSKFKSKFNPQIFVFTGEYDLVINKFIYNIYNIALKLLRKK